MGIQDKPTTLASHWQNAFAERLNRKDVRAVAKLMAAQIFLAVHRIDYSVYFRRLEVEEFVILTALRDGEALGAAVELGFRKSTVALEQRPAKVQEWFATWAALGWFCRPEAKRAARA